MLGEEWSEISESAKDLLRKMFEIKPEYRISANEALNEPWFKEQITQRPVKRFVVLNLTKFFVEFIRFYILLV